MLEGPEPACGEAADCPFGNRRKGTPRTSRTGADSRASSCDFASVDIVSRKPQLAILIVDNA